MTTRISPAIIMRIKEFGESDLMVTFFTSDRGRLRGVAKAARKSKRRFANCLDLFCLTNLEYELRKRGDLYFLHSCRLVNGFPGLRSDFSALSLASYVVELTEILFPLGVVDRDMFELLKWSFLLLSEGKSSVKTRVLFEGKAMALAGYGIDLSKCSDCGRPYTGKGGAVFRGSKGGIACLRCGKDSRITPGLGPQAIEVLRAIQTSQWSEVVKLDFSDETSEEMKRVLRRHIEYQIGKRLKTSEYLE
jgi:DNA repair protein RecO (recombination protein O)